MAQVVAAADLMLMLTAVPTRRVKSWRRQRGGTVMPSYREKRPCFFQLQDSLHGRREQIQSEEEEVRGDRGNQSTSTEVECTNGTHLAMRPL